MNSESRMFNISELPDYLFERTSRLVHKFSTVLFRVPHNLESSKKVLPIGSGTFISIDEVYGILTATHVIRELGKHDDLGFVLIEDGILSTINRQLLVITEIGDYKTKSPSDGPDLAFVRLPLPKVSEIKTYQSFMNLSKDRTEMLDEPPDHHDGYWFIYGAPGELTKFENLGEGSVGSICGIGGVTKEYIVDGFDYIETIVEYSTPVKEGHLEIPKSLGGMSGGGLWLVMFQVTDENEFFPSRYLLHGVPFYQSALDDHKRVVKCHSRISVYKHLLDTISAPNPSCT